MEDTENEREKADAEGNLSHFEGMAGARLLANTDVARSDVSCGEGKILALEASLHWILGATARLPESFCL